MNAGKWLLFSTLLILAAMMFAAVLTPSIRESVRGYMGIVGREVLATAQGDALNNKTICKVIKYRNNDGIWVEVLKIQPDGKNKFVDRFLLPDKHDGLFNFQGHVTHLAIADVDLDGKVEIMAPTFDQQLVPHLNVFRYNPTSSKFEPYQPNR